MSEDRVIEEAKTVTKPVPN